MTASPRPSAPTAPSDATFQIEDEGRLVALAQVHPTGTAGVVHSALSVAGGHLPAGTRTRLVDAVLDCPEVRGAERLLATLPVSDTEMLDRLRQRCAVVETRAAGATKLVEARIPSPRRPL